MYIIGGLELPIKWLAIWPFNTHADEQPVQHNRLVWTDFYTSHPFLSAWSNVESLSLSGLMDDREIKFCGVLVATADDLRKPDIRNRPIDLRIAGIIDHASTMQLQELDIGGGELLSSITVPAMGHLQRTLQHRGAYLRRLTIKRIILNGSSWIPLLSPLRQHNTALEEIEISDLEIGHPEYWSLHFPGVSVNHIVDPVTGSKFIYPSAGKNLTIRYAGPRMDLALQKIEQWAQGG
ncbi:hypothetical protein BJY01DRAFT_151767 [Aspergillus pseudoustus]|uniref:Uncharacterized protein n=1 Tax=Aspergillus pseudoustus TaxID=1810923 RepID=A0ABR4IDQ4_9EURO